MPKYSLRLLLLIISFAFTFSLAQTPDEQIKQNRIQQTELIERISKDTEGLRLPENRALVAVKIGDAVWTSDEKRARQFFQTAVNEIISAQTEAESEKRPGSNSTNMGLVYGSSPRWEILTLIANRDAEFALESFYRSRPSKISFLLAKMSGGKNDENEQYAKNETNFEQTLINRLSEQSPQRALKLLNENLKNGVSYEALGLIEKLREKDLDAANQVAAAVAEKIMEADFGKDSQTYSIASSFLSIYGKAPEADQKFAIKIEKKLLVEMAGKIARNLLKSDEDNAYEIESLLPLMESLSPANVAALRQKMAKSPSQSQRQEYAVYSKLMESEPTPEKLLSEAEKFSDEYKNQIYYAAAEKFARSNNIAQAKKILTSNLPESESENYLTQINYGIISQAMADGKFEEAVALINQIKMESNRFYFLIQLATTIYQKDPAENKKLSLNVFDQARAMIPQTPDTIEDMSSLMTLAYSLAGVDEEQAFQLVESLIYPTNEYTEAALIVSKYRNDGTLRQGEMILNSYGSVSSFQSLTPTLLILKNKDYKRTMAVINNFQRPEIRLILQMQMIENFEVNNSATSSSPASVASNTSISNK
jgi:hypothetical protein